MQDAVADAAIARRVLAREPAGYADLYDRYSAPLYAFCYTMLGDRERAAVALGMTFMIAVCRLDELRDPDRLRPWLYALARNECRCRASWPGGPGSGRVRFRGCRQGAGWRTWQRGAAVAGRRAAGGSGAQPCGDCRRGYARAQIG